ncbi:MAG: DUF998 domain-containing protein [Nanoarchaeota archaeon]
MIEKYGDIIAIMGFAVFSIFTFIAIFLTPGFNIATQYFSELGVSGLSAVFFNSGLILFGILLIPFYMKLRYDLGNSKLMKTTLILGIASCFALMGIGLFPLTQRIMHNFFNYTFFSLLTVVIFLTSAIMISKKQMFHGLVGFVVIFFNTVFAFIINETALQKFSIFTLELWVLTVIFYLMLERSS